MHLFLRYLAHRRQKLLEQMPQANVEQFTDLKAQIGFLDLLTPTLRDDLKEFYKQQQEQEAP